MSCSDDHASKRAGPPRPPAPRGDALPPAAPGAAALPARCVVAIAASTGGPRALAELVARLPAALNAAVLVVQHMPPFFTRALADRLHARGPLAAREASAGSLLLPGTVYVAPGGFHLRLELATSAGAVRVRLDTTPPLHGVRPAADPAFEAVARCCGERALGVVLSGMGRDGADGLRAIRAAGGWTAVQDGSASLQGMPRAARPYAQHVLPLAALAACIAHQVRLRAPDVPRQSAAGEP